MEPSVIYSKIIIELCIFSCNYLYNSSILIISHCHDSQIYISFFSLLYVTHLDSYMKLFNSLLQEPGEAEKDFASIDTALLFKNLLSNNDPSPPRIHKETGFSGLLKTPKTLPSWLSEENINYYANIFNKTGFTGGLNYYRAMKLYVSCFFFVWFWKQYIVYNIYGAVYKSYEWDFLSPLTFEQNQKNFWATILLLRLASTRESICLKQ